MIMSSMPIEMPAWKAVVKPSSLSLSSISTVDGVAGDLVGVQDQVAELGLGEGEVDEAEAGGPDLVEDHAADGGAKNLLSLLP